MKKILLVLAAIAAGVSLNAKVTLPSFFSDNMVLQQKADVAFWGSTDKRRKVSITPSWCKTRYSVLPDSEGKWFIRIPTPEAGGPYTIVFNDGDKTILENVLLGEVWFCSGQSNMEMPMRGFEGQPVEGAADCIIRANANTPIRICNITKKKSATPLDTVDAKWKCNTPEVVTFTSAAAYFFACRLHEVLDVPVGILSAYWGGTAIEAWMPRETIEKEFSGEIDTSVLDTEDIADLKGSLHPSILWNGMVAALVPFTFKGMLWYQGETNRGRPELYTRLQVSYVKMMREKFQNPDAPFYFTQIAPYAYGLNGQTFKSGYFYEAQQKTLALIPHSGMAPTIDIGSYYTVHPPKKKEVGDRLALLALVNDYGIKGIYSNAPVYKSVEFNDAKAVVTVEVDRLGLSPRVTPVSGFELAGEDRVFHPATGMADKNTITVTSEDVQNPVAVRYCFRNWGKGTVFNAFGIPLLPFRTDNWDDLME